MIYLQTYETFVTESHHMLSGENSLSDLAHDLIEFVQWQMSHSIKKKKEYDSKKYMYYYRWDYDEIINWFAEQDKKFHYPVFLIEHGSTIDVKISLARMVKGRRKEHETNELIRTKGNERASHAAKKTGKESKKHVIYLNAYYLAKEKNMDVRKFIMSDDFEKELTGTVRHEFMHAFDTYTISTKKREGIDKMKKLHKAYRAKYKIGKEWVTFKEIGTWSGKKFTPDMDMLSKDNNLKTFMYMLLYYLTDTEMNAYLQTFYNQVINSDEKDIYSSDTFKRYKIIKTVLETDFDKSVIEKTWDEKTRKEFSEIIKIYAEPIEYHEKFKKLVLRKLDKYFNRLNKIFFDIKSSLSEMKK